MKIGIASDHRGFNLKKEVINFLESENYEVVDYGTNSIASVDYPDYSLRLGTGIKKLEVNLGIVICGTGIGVSIACNKIKGVRCAKVRDFNEAKYARLHNDANIVAIGATIDLAEAKKIVSIFLETSFSNEERHIRRLKKIEEIEDSNL